MRAGHIIDRPAGQRPLRLLAIGEGGASTGFSRALDSLLLQLVDTIEVHQLLTGMKRVGAEPPWTVHTVSRSTDISEHEAVARVIANVHPDAVVVCHDFGLVHQLRDVLFSADCRVPVVAYGPLDGRTMHPQVVETLLHTALVVTFTQQSSARLAAMLSPRSRVRKTAEPPAVVAIPLGVDPQRFKPLAERYHGEKLHYDRTRLYRQAFGARAPRARGFVVLNANRNHIRKRIDITCEAFARFARDKPEGVKLCLHMAASGRQAWTLKTLIRRYKLEDRVILTSGTWRLPDLSDAELNVLYNACDVGVNSSVGEGWGLIAYEHASTGAAQLLPDHTACRSEWSDRGLLVGCTRSLPTDTEYYEEHVVYADDLAQQLERLYVQPGLLEEASWKAYQHASSPRYDWRHIGMQWKELLAMVTSAQSPAVVRAAPHLL